MLRKVRDEVFLFAPSYTKTFGLPEREIDGRAAVVSWSALEFP